ncbi:ATP-binding protein [Streptosporangium sp. NBC_01495]|uniref:ATP-binding protein n=1 Tax=Streptosporangium sp. NBC_01495 TaxID=2903899 RepID=UPI002E31E7AD|nr:ATP-binding protein [Streptosporangium sp. NBC_01495]
MDIDDLTLFSRRAHGMVREALTDTRVVMINGARQTGKSTLAQAIARETPGARELFLDQAAVRAAARQDPDGVVHHDGLVLIDEIQRVPDLLLSIKHEVDSNPRPGRFLLTGSARLLGLKDLPDALPGRSETIELWPLSQGEIEQKPDGFVDSVFQNGADIEIPRPLFRRADYLDRAMRGGYPEAVQRPSHRRRARFFDSYITDLINRDVKQVADIEHPADMRRLLNILAGRMGGLAVTDNISRDLGLPRTTVKRYLDLLDLVYLIKRIPAWSSNATTRAVATPKLLVVDSGLGAHLAGLTSGRVSDVTAPVGPLMENFALSELARQLTWSEEPIRLYHYRDRDGVEVDGILERASGEVIGIEVKASETVRADDFKGLQHLSRKLGDRMMAGFVLYAGRETLPFGDRMRALPLAALWLAESPSEVNS